MSANVQSMMYVGERPWHGLGNRIKAAATAAEAIVEAGLDWRVTEGDLYLKDGTAVPSHKAIIREDDLTQLGVVGKDWCPLQNKEAFSFFDAVVGAKEAIYHTAGALGHGERVWILAKVNGLVQIVGNDVAEKYLLLANAHDGSLAVTMMFTPIRVVCQNTLNLAIGARNLEQPGKYKLRHTAALGTRINDVREALGIVNARFDLFGELARRMAVTQLTSEAVKGYFRNVTGAEAKLAEGKEISTRSENIMEELSRLFETGRGADLPGAKGTAWGAFNAVAEYVDYTRATKSNGVGKEMKRAESLLFGSGAVLKQKAWDQALVLAK